jgi:hypothetical protein
MGTLTIEAGLVYKLTNTVGLTALISTRVYLERIPQGATLPCLTYQRISTPRVHTHDTSGSAGTAYPRFQFDAWATTYASAKAITDALRAALNGYKGTITSGADSVVVQASLVESETSQPDLEADLARISSEYVIWHLEA